ncbi:SRPBCC family protein [Paenibacillus sp. FSL H7-0357]|uniref:SRPBCC family protein n=1 Tax=Paenibacillus sp. FSL H7-0357 TaxID=1536774 RepID=UPI0006895D27|nr:SRPBCC family protein [Paenibacillus sp. FSL H7-0357]
MHETKTTVFPITPIVTAVHTARKAGQTFPGFTANTLIDGNERTLILADGSSVKEWIVSIDEEERRLVFAVKEGRMPLLHHNASFQILPDSQGGSQFVWITDFLPAELTEAIQTQVVRVSAVIKQTLETESK